MKNKNKSVNGSSQKGKWGKVGAPPKPTKFPSGPFTMAKLFAVNSKGKYAQCQLSLRNKVDSLLATGELISLKPKKQPKGQVGRPAPVYVLKSNFNPAKMATAPAPVKTGKRPTAEVETPAPATAPTAEVAVPAPEVPAPVVVAEVAPTPAPVENITVPPAETETSAAALMETVISSII